VSRLIATLAAAALCSGCLGSALESKREAPEVYRLSAPVLADSGGALPASLAVGRPRAPMSLDTPRIAVAGPQARFDYYAGVRWAEPAPLMLQQLLVQALAADGRFATVVAAPSRVPSEFLLDVELRQFEATSDGSATPVVRVRLQATLMDSRNGTRLASYSAESEVAAAAPRRDAVVSAFDEATRQALASVVTGTRNASAAAAP
jgi:cholesterol transport system auxiliary component